MCQDLWAKEVGGEVSEEAVDEDSQVVKGATQNFTWN